MRKVERNAPRYLAVWAFFALFAFLGLASVAGADPVKIGGKRLDDVQDILTETAGTRVFRKHSLIKPVWYRPNNSSDSGSNLRFYYVNFDASSGASHERGGDPIHNAPPADSEWTSGMHPAVSSKPGPDGRSHRVVLPDFSHHGHDRWYHTYTVYVDANGAIQTSSPKRLPTGVPQGNVYPTDATAGLFVDGEDEESFVVARMTVHEGGQTHLGDKETRYDCYLEFLDGKKLEDDGNPTALSHNTGYAMGLYPFIRVVAGDFDNDGIASEVAYIRSGAADNYSFEILKVSRNADGSFRATSLYAQDVGHRDKNGKNIEGCDVVAGDFNGDGKQEIAAVFNDLSGTDGHATVQVFYRSEGGFASKYRSVRDNDHRLGGTNFSAYIPYYGLVADAGDLDGDGRDEIVYAAPLYGVLLKEGRLLVSTWGTDDTFNPSEKSTTLTSFATAGKIPSYIYNFMLRSVSLTLAPVSGNTGGMGAACADLLLSTTEGYDAHLSGNHVRGDRLYLFKSQFNPDGRFSGFSSEKQIAAGSNGWAVGLLTADFAGESLILEAPTHLIVRDKKTYAAMMQTPPYHVDYVPSPWADDPTAPALTNFSYTGGTATYAKSETESEARDTAFEARHFAELGIDAGLSLGGAIKKLAGFSVGGKASVGWKKSTSQTLSEANKSSVSVGMNMSSSTDTSDNLMFYKSDYHIWRYPIVAPVPAELFGEPTGGTISGEEDGTQYFTYTMSDEPTRVEGDAGQSSQFDDYNPIHEEGNLFSYPTTIEATPGYSEKQTALSLENQKTLGGAFTEDLIFSRQTSEITSLKTTARNQFNGSLSLNLGWPKIAEGSLSAGAMFGDEVGDSSTFTKGYQASEKFQVAFPAPILGFNFDYVAYLLKMRAYSDAAGVMNMAFAVDLADNPNAWLWRTGGDSVYAKKPDPALVLPGRYNRIRDIRSGSEIIRWVANADAQSATQIRGIWFRDKDLDEYAPSSLTRGRSYTISLPVYNASFVDAGSVPVEVGYRDSGGTARQIGRYSVTLGGWQKDTENNKATLAFDWTVPADMAEGRYDFYFQIDPDNVLDEIHENWNTTSGDAGYDPGGNNLGRYPFAVTSEAASARSARGDGSGYFTVTIDGMSLADFRRSLSDRTEDFRAYGIVTYHGDEPLTNVYVEIVDHPDGTGEGHVQRLIANRHVPAIFPGKQEHFSFLASPSNIRNTHLTVSLFADNATLTTEVTPDRQEGDGSGGGCHAGATGMIVLAALATAHRKRKGRR